MNNAAYDDATELIALAGIALNSAQQKLLQDSLRETENGHWVTCEIKIPDQTVILARELIGLFLLNEIILHTAFLHTVTAKAFRRTTEAVKAPIFQKRIKRITHAYGAESIELYCGARILFRTRGAGRGFSCDCLIIEDAHRFSETDIGMLLPAMASRPNPQVWYA